MMLPGGHLDERKSIVFVNTLLPLTQESAEAWAVRQEYDGDT